MIDIALLAGRLLLLALLYLFLFAAVKTGIGLVAGQRAKGKGAWTLSVVQGPRELQGVSVPITGPAATHASRLPATARCWKTSARLTARYSTASA